MMCERSPWWSGGCWWRFVCLRRLSPDRHNRLRQNGPLGGCGAVSRVQTMVSTRCSHWRRRGQHLDRGFFLLFKKRRNWGEPREAPTRRVQLGSWANCVFTRVTFNRLICYGDYGATRSPGFLCRRPTNAHERRRGDGCQAFGWMIAWWLKFIIIARAPLHRELTGPKGCEGANHTSLAGGNLTAARFTRNRPPEKGARRDRGRRIIW